MKVYIYKTKRFKEQTYFQQQKVVTWWPTYNILSPLKSEPLLEFEEICRLTETFRTAEPAEDFLLLTASTGGRSEEPSYTSVSTTLLSAEMIKHSYCIQWTYTSTGVKQYVWKVKLAYIKPSKTMVKTLTVTGNFSQRHHWTLCFLSKLSSQNDNCQDYRQNKNNNQKETEHCRMAVKLISFNDTVFLTIFLWRQLFLNNTNS